ncbi:MAG TPA: DUF4337 domain-containing protein [Thermoanaerobaculia bacterium]|jgi:hypothetical protein|nr:DUF4337 domain-containing protein [Thermoanaerobaculia bacterium]
MPEGPEVDTDRLHEQIHEELEREGGALVKQIALTTAIFAAFAAVASLLAGSTVNEALVLKNEATQLQGKASDQWAYYQAKGIKAAVQSAIGASWASAGKPVPPSVEAAEKKYGTEQQEISVEAKKLEKERDEKSSEADELIHRHHRFAAAVAIFQVAIALGAVGALTRLRIVWVGSFVTGLVAIVYFLLPFFGR